MFVQYGNNLTDESPERCLTVTIQERKNTFYPENINLEDYEVIGSDITHSSFDRLEGP